jgi:5,10-methylenetetrahydromethanopterin reductase
MNQVSIAFQTDKSPADYIALAQLVNQYDFDVVSVYCDAPFHPSYGPLLLMAPHIQHARLGPAAVSASRMPPIDIAANTALLAGMAPGGAYLGIARGAWLADHGITEVERPIQAVREAIEITRRLLSGESGGYTLAGEIADEVKIGGTANPDVIPVIRDYIAVGERLVQREPGSVGIVVGAVSVIDEDRERAREAARRSVALYLPVVAQLDPTVQVEPELIERLQTLVKQHDNAAAAHLISDDLLERFAFAGNAADIIRQSEKLFAAGASRIEFGTPHGIPPQNGIRILGEQVIPRLFNRR